MDVDGTSGSQGLFDAGGSTWCGKGCGACYKVKMPPFFWGFRILRRSRSPFFVTAHEYGQGSLQYVRYGRWRWSKYHCHDYEPLSVQWEQPMVPSALYFQPVRILCPLRHHGPGKLRLGRV